MLKIILLLALAISATLMYMKPPAPELNSSTTPMLHGLPWQIDLQDGNSRVFGITLGVSTLAEATATINREYELAILAKHQQPGALELYYYHFKAGQLQGKLLLVINIDDETLAKMKTAAASHKVLDNGTKKYSLSQQQLAAVQQHSIRSITFVPTASLSKQLIEQQFGKTEQQLATSDKVTHYLYPRLGLDILVNDGGKDLMQYVAPSQFSLLQATIQRQAEKHTEY